MVTRAHTILGTGDAVEDTARAVVATLEEFADEGEPVIAAYRAVQDGPWMLDILFTDERSDAPFRERWLDAARSVLPDLPPFAFDPLAERDWVAESQKALHPVTAGRFVIHGSHDTDRLIPSQWRILIDAGRAFGTAHHASTFGCLLALEWLAKRGPLGSVHDVGTGSGVLAIAAAKLGAGPVSAGDIDPVAVRVARANVAINRVPCRVRVRTSAGPYRSADTVLANILARPLIAMAPAISLATGRTLILSGLRQQDRRRVEAAYRARGLAVHHRIVVDDWVTLILRRNRTLPSRQLRPTSRPAASWRD